MGDTASDRPKYSLEGYLAAFDTLYRKARSPKSETIARWIADNRHHTIAATTIEERLPPNPVIPRDPDEFRYMMEYLHSCAGKEWNAGVEERWELRRAAAAQERRRRRGSSTEPQKELQTHLHDEQTHLGRPLAEITNPFALEVQHPIEIDDAPDLEPLPPYVRRDHDARLDDVVAHAAAGRTRMVVLVGDSATGKTRALWEALQPLREAGWRLWHPWTPTWQQALHDGITHVGQRTVLWLNETQRYLGAEEAERERIATSLRELLTDARRAPVLIVGTLWKGPYDALSDKHDSATRRLLTDIEIVPVPTAFTGDDLAAMRQASDEDPRLKLAVERAEAGQVTQYLAGGPALIDRYKNKISRAAQAVVEVAMDAVRLGHRNVLPHELLHVVAAHYMSDTEWDELDEENWFEQALAETSRRCKGVRGPVTRIRHRPLLSQTTSRSLGRGAAGPAVYQLADFLDFYGRRTRVEIPPMEFWEAAALYCDPEDQFSLGLAAADRGLRREAAQLWKNAAGRKHVGAAVELVRAFQSTHPDDDRPLSWLASQGILDDLDALVLLLHQGPVMDESSKTRARIAAWVDPDRVCLQRQEDENDLDFVLLQLQRAGFVEKAKVIAARAAVYDALSIEAQTNLLSALPELVGLEEAKALADRIDLSRVASDNAEEAGRLAVALRNIGESEKAKAAADRIDPERIPPPTGFFSLDVLREILYSVGLPAKAEAVTAHVAATFPLDNPNQLADLLNDMGLGNVAEDEDITQDDDITGAMEAVIDRIDPVKITVGNPDEPLYGGFSRVEGLFSLIKALRNMGQDDKAKAIAAHITYACFDHPRHLAEHLDTLRDLGADDNAKAIAARVDPGKFDLDFIWIDVAPLMHLMRSVNMAPSNMLVALANRASSTTEPKDLAALVESLRRLGAGREAVAAASRAAPHVNLSRPIGLARLLRVLVVLHADTVIDTIVARIDPDQIIAGQPRSYLKWTLWRRDGENEIHALILQLQDLGVTELAAAIVARLPAAGLFPVFLRQSEQRGQFVFGRNPIDGSPSPAWDWDDLT